MLELFSLSPRESVGVRGRLSAKFLLFFLFAGALSVAGSPASRPRAVPEPPLDFSGVWELDPEKSLNVSPRMRGAVLSVRQEGNRISIFPVTPGSARQTIPSEEIVADGRAYEKILGPAGKGLVTADWAGDGKSLWIEIRLLAPENPKAPVQRSVWKLSEDRTVWVRESVSLSDGKARSARLVFRRKKPEGK